MKNWAEFLRSCRLLGRLAYRAWPFGAISDAVLHGLRALTGPLTAVALMYLVDAVADGRASSASGWMVVVVVATLAGRAVNRTTWFINQRLSALVSHEMTRQVMASAAGMDGIEHLENPEYADRLAVVERHLGTPLVGTVYELLSLLSGLVGFLAAVVALAAIHPLLPLPAVLGAAIGPIRYKLIGRQWDYIDQSAPAQRLAGELLRLTTTPPAAKEVRIFGLGPHLVDQYLRARSEARRSLRRGARLNCVMAATTGVAYSAGLVAGIAFLARLAFTGSATPGELAMGIALLQQVIGSVNAMSISVSTGMGHGALVRRYRELLEYQSPVVVSEAAVAVPEPLRDGIVFEGVGFSYPGRDRAALNEVSLRFPAGSSVALVGDNGAGKSTLVKLLCRLYDPTAGRILVDGIDLKDLDLARWRKRITASLQDFARFEFLLQETVGVGNVAEVANDHDVARAVKDAGAGSIVDDLPEGLMTQLGRQFPGGHDLSVGQWQRLGIARALMACDPMVVILDEPSANLDPKAEHQVFERFMALVEAGREKGVVTVLVSHRFSTVQMADLIVVMEEGRVVQTGSHKELLDCDGVYAELYGLQAGKYL